MFRIADRYIIGKFLTTFFFMLGIIMLFAVVFDVSEKLSEFISNKAPVKEIILDYYVSFVLFHGNMFSSMIIFISVIWFTAKMAQDSEIIPLWFSGRPIIRFMRPYMVASTLLMILSLVLNHYIVPNANKVRLAFEEKYYRDDMRVENYHADYPNHTHVYFSNYSNHENRVSNFVIQRWNDSLQPQFFLKANEAFNAPNSNRWHFKNVYVKNIRFPQGALLFRNSLDTILPFEIREMAQRENVAETMTRPELAALIQKEKAKGSAQVPYYEIEMHQRTSYPFATYILTIIGVSVASRKKRGGIGINIAIGLLFVFIYIFAMKVMAVAAWNVGFPAFIAVWIPNFIFAIIALVLYRTAQR